MLPQILMKATLNGMQSSKNVGDDAHIVPQPYGTSAVH